MSEFISSLATLAVVIFIYLIPIVFIIYVALAWSGYTAKIGEYVFKNVSSILNSVNNLVVGIKNFGVWSCKLKVKIVSTVILILYIVLVILYFIYC